MTVAAIPASLSPARVRYQTVLAVASVAIFFTNAAVYLFDAGVWPVPPLVLIGLFAALALPLYLSRAVSDQVLGGPFFLWIVGYAALSSAGFLYSSGSETALGVWRGVLLACLLLVSALAVFSEAGARKASARAIVAATVLAVALNFYETLHPQAFGLFAGRPAGLYRNPNISGGAIIFGLILGQRALSPSRRPLYLLLTGAGVLLTLSRSAILGWGMIAFMLLALREIRVGRGWLLAGLLGAFMIAALVPAGTWTALFEAAQVLSSDQVTRLTLAGAGAGTAEVSTSVRLEVARAGLVLFGEHPVFGAGLAATTEWSLPGSTHNMYLRFLAELGLVGLAYYLAGCAAMLWGAPRRLRWLTLPFGTWWLFFGMFSHNLLEERAGLLSAALVAATVVAERRKSMPVEGDGW